MFPIPVGLKVVVFDLDGTLHDVKSSWMTPSLERHIVDILRHFREAGIVICLASMNLLGGIFLYEYNVFHMFKHVFQREEDMPANASKEKMLRSIIKETKCGATSILFFDDYIGHVATARQLGMKAVCVNEKRLLTWRDVKQGLDLFDKRKRRFSI